MAGTNTYTHTLSLAQGAHYLCDYFFSWVQLSACMNMAFSLAPLHRDLRADDETHLSYTVGTLPLLSPESKEKKDKWENGSSWLLSSLCDI